MRKAGRKWKTFYKNLREKRKVCDNNDGFTLVELLVAIAILTLVILPTLEVFVTATRTNSKARTELQATITANSVLESAKAFSIYVFDKQCNQTYNSGNAGTFTLVAGEADGGTVKSLIQAGGTCGQVVFDSDGKTVKEIIKDGTAFDDKGKDRFAYAINGIKQSNSVYDAVVIYTQRDYQDVNINGTAYTETNVASKLPNYNKEYDITVYIYKHNSSGDAGYIGKNLYDSSGALVTITGSKLDSAQKPGS